MGSSLQQPAILVEDCTTNQPKPLLKKKKTSTLDAVAMAARLLLEDSVWAFP